MAYHASVLPVEERSGAVLLGVIERHTLCKVRVRRGCRSQVEQRRPPGTVRRHEHRRVLDLLRQGQELLAQGVRRLMLGTHVIIIPQATQHREKLVGVVQVVTELPARA